MERAIAEINELKPDIVVCSGDLTTFGFKEEYAQAKRYLDRIECESLVVIPGNHDSRNVGYVHFEELFGERNSVLRKGRRDGRGGRLDRARPRPRADRPRALRLDRGAVRGGAVRACASSCCTTTCCRFPGTGRERNVVYDAGDAIECLQRAGVHLVLSGHKHVPYAWKLENLFVVNTGTVSTLRLSGQHAALLQRRRGVGHRTSRSGGGIPFTVRSGSSSSTCRPASTRSTPAGSSARSRRSGDARCRADRRGALRARGARRAAGAAVRVGRRDPGRRHREAARRASRYGVPLVDGFGDAEVVVDLSDEPVLGPAERFRWVSRALAAGLAVRRRRLPFRSAVVRAVRAAVDRRHRHRQARGEDGGHRAPRAAARARARRASSSRWAAAGRRSPSSSRSRRRVAELVARSRVGQARGVGPPRDGRARPA